MNYENNDSLTNPPFDDDGSDHNKHASKKIESQSTADHLADYDKISKTDDDTIGIQIETGKRSCQQVFIIDENNLETQKGALPGGKEVIGSTRKSTYHDYSNASTDLFQQDEQPCIPNITTTQGVAIRASPVSAKPIRTNTFPILLHKMLKLTDDFPDCYHVEGVGIMAPNTILRWEHHGRSFVILDKQKLVQYFFPLFFPYQTEYPSFQRQLNIYGFKRICIKKGEKIDNDVTKRDIVKLHYYHEMMLRTRPDLCYKINRRLVKNKQKKVSTGKSQVGLESQPEFDSYPPLLHKSNEIQEKSKKQVAPSLKAAPIGDNRDTLHALPSQLKKTLSLSSLSIASSTHWTLNRNQSLLDLFIETDQTFPASLPTKNQQQHLHQTINNLSAIETNLAAMPRTDGTSEHLEHSNILQQTVGHEPLYSTAHQNLQLEIHRQDIHGPFVTADTDRLLILSSAHKRLLEESLSSSSDGSFPGWQHGTEALLSYCQGRKKRSSSESSVNGSLSGTPAFRSSSMPPSMTRTDGRDPYNAMKEASMFLQRQQESKELERSCSALNLLQMPPRTNESVHTPQVLENMASASQLTGNIFHETNHPETAIMPPMVDIDPYSSNSEESVLSDLFLFLNDIDL